MARSAASTSGRLACTSVCVSASGSVSGIGSEAGRVTGVTGRRAFCSMCNTCMVPTIASVCLAAANSAYRGSSLSSTQRSSPHLNDVLLPNRLPAEPYSPKSDALLDNRQNDCQVVGIPGIGLTIARSDLSAVLRSTSENSSNPELIMASHTPSRPRITSASASG